MRSAVRAGIARARAMRETDDPADPDRLPVARATAALRILLTAVGRATAADTDNPDETEAIRRGAARVAATLADPALKDTLAAATDNRQVVPMSPGDAGVLRRLRALGDWTEALLDLRSDRQRRIMRRLPWAALALGVLIAGAALLGDRNLARGRSVVVTASSLCPSTPSPPEGRPRLFRLVDGQRVERSIPGIEWGHGTYAACTTTQVHPWITIDLGIERTIHKVVVYNRSDCCWGVDDTPVSIQLSNDNDRFDTVATRTDPFTDDFPWRQAIAGRRARYVRLYNPSDRPKNMVFSEIEIHGR